MPIVATDTADVPDSARPYLISVVEGKSVALRSPLFGDLSVDQVVEQWNDVLDSELQPSFSALRELEDEQRLKIGPKSIQLPLRERLPDIESYYSSFITPEVDILREVVPTLNAFVRPHRMRPISARNAAKLLPMNTNSGLPAFAKRKTVVDDALLEVQKGHAWYPAVIGWRGQSNGTDKPKQRVVWIVSLNTNIIEKQYVQPVHEWLTTMKQFAAWVSMDAVDIEMTRLLDASDDYGPILSSDYSGFDQHTGPEQMRVYKRFMKHLFQPQYHLELERWITNVNTMELVIDVDHKFIGNHGLASGSGGTNQIGTVINHEMFRSSPYVGLKWVLTLGDDGVGRCLNVDQHLAYLGRLGYVANPDKQMIATDRSHFLQRLYLKDYRPDGQYVRGIFPSMRALGAALYPERFHDAKVWNSVMETLRLIMIAENVKWHPLFPQFVHFLLDGDSYAKENIRALISNDTHINQAKRLPGFISSYTQVSGFDKGIEQFETVKIAKTRYNLA